MARFQPSFYKYLYLQFILGPLPRHLRVYAPVKFYSVFFLRTMFLLLVAFDLFLLEFSDVTCLAGLCSKIVERC